MDAVPHHDGNPQSISMASGPSRNTKRTRENDDEALRIKREKAAERQRRKRERDRNAAGLGGAMGFPSQNGHDAHQQQLQAERQPESVSTGPNFNGEELSPEEQARRDRVRLSARERQRKHRSLVKARKLRELGLDMGNEIMPGMDEVHYRVGPDGHYTQIMPHELQHNPHVPHESSFPQGQGQTLGGQTFASTLLLSFSSAPLLKQHLLRTLSMTNEELTSLEPIIADAWDQWDHQVRFISISSTRSLNRPYSAGYIIKPPTLPKHPDDPCLDRPFILPLKSLNTLSIRTQMVTKTNLLPTSFAQGFTDHW
jgi:hypothetical protein